MPRTKTPKASRAKRLALLFCMLPNIVMAQKDIIIFHNCENLFYPTNDTLTQDNDFTSEGKKHWTFERYKKKYNLLAKTYIAAGEGSFPSIVGLCEVESDRVLEDLCKGTPLRKANYQFIHYDSKDIRGIDVALVYNPSRFKPKEHYKITPESKDESERTRDVLYVCGLLGDKSVNIYVVHAPSRREHNAKQALRKSIFDSIYSHIKQLKARGEENFIIMGDMNDNPWDEAIVKGFHTLDKEPFLINLMQNNKKKAGSYVYNGQYLSFDQFIVSTNLCQYIEDKGDAFVMRNDFLVDDNPKNKLITPYSTYRGLKYQGGISDHFPIVMTLSEKAQK